MSDQPVKHVGHNYFIQAVNSGKVLEAMAAQDRILRRTLDSGDDTIVVQVDDSKNGPPFFELKLVDGCTEAD